MFLQRLPIFTVIFSLLLVFRPVPAYAADANVGNEVVDTFNSTLTRTGTGTAVDPYKLQLNVGNANTWTAAQTINAALNANGALTATGNINLGDGGDTASMSGTTVTFNTGDNNANAFLVQQGVIKYLQVKTTDSAENISFGNTTTNPSYNFLGVGAANFGGAVNASSLVISNAITANSLSTTSSVNTSALTATGTVSASSTFNATGKTTFSPSGTNGVTVNTDSDSKLTVTGLTTASGSALCLDGSNNMVLCSAAASSSLQSAYDTGNTIATTNGRDVAYTLADNASDSNFTVTTATGATGATQFIRADGSGTADPSQLVLIDNADTDRALPTGLKVSSSGSGGVTTAIDASDANIDAALNAGANDVNGTNWSVTGSTGNLQTSGDVAVNGGDVTTTSTTGNLFNTSATTVNIAGAATSLTLGGTFGTTTLRNSTVNLSNATTFNASSATGNLNSVNIGGGYGSTGVTLSSSGNVSANGNITVDGTSALTGNVTTASDVAVNGGDITTTASTANLFNTNATTLNLGGAATSVNIAGSTGTTTVNNDLTVMNALTANGGATVSTGQSFNANGDSTFSPNGTHNVTVNLDSDSNLVLTGLSTVASDPLCLDASNNVVKCAATPSDRRLKKNITDLTDVLPSVLKVQGVRYDLKTQEDSAPGQGKNIGFIAQDIEKYFPELVKTDDHGIKSVDYEKMTAVLVESTKEQQKEIDELKAEVQELKALIKEK